MYILIPKYGFGVTFPGEARGIFPLRGKPGNFSTRVKKIRQAPQLHLARGGERAKRSATPSKNCQTPVSRSVLGYLKGAIPQGPMRRSMEGNGAWRVLTGLL